MLRIWWQLKQLVILRQYLEPEMSLWTELIQLDDSVVEEMTVDPNVVCLNPDKIQEN